MRCSAQCANFQADFLWPSAATTVPCETPPNATMHFRLGIAAISSARKGRQALISGPVGLFCGGTQRTPLVSRQSRNSSPSSARLSYRPLAKPNRDNVSYSRSPAKSPVNGRPVRFAPFRPGASPTIKRRAFSGPKAGTGALKKPPKAVRLSRRKLASRGQRPQFFAGSRALVTVWNECAGFRRIPVIRPRCRRVVGQALLAGLLRHGRDRAADGGRFVAPSR